MMRKVLSIILIIILLSAAVFSVTANTAFGSGRLRIAAGSGIKSAEILNEEAAAENGDLSSPPSSVAAIVAVSSLGCIALAGAVVIKKRK